jgi:hypothetical protein
MDAESPNEGATVWLKLAALNREIAALYEVEPALSAEERVLQRDRMLQLALKYEHYIDGRRLQVHCALS